MDQRLQNVDTIVFDVGNVLLTFEEEKVAQLLPPSVRGPLAQALFGPRHLWSKFDHGLESNAQIARQVTQEAGLPGREAEVLSLLERFPETMSPLPLSRLAPLLKSQGKRLFALTNYAEPSFSITCRRFPFLTECFDGWVVSSREKLVKPDPAFFRLLTERYGVRPDAALFIDDLRQNVDAAAALGYAVWHYAGEDRL